MEYPFKTTPYKHQLDCFNLSKDRDVFALFMEMGTGKSKVILDTAGYLFLTGKINGLVIVAPKGAYLNWIDDEIPKHMSEAVPVRIAHWSSYGLASVKDAIKKLYLPSNSLRVFVVNVEALAMEKAANEIDTFLDNFQSLMVVDESTTIKNRDAKRTKIIINLGKQARYRRICTGNPIPNSPLDLYSQTEFLRKNLLGFGNFFAFRNRYAIMLKKQLGKQCFESIVGYRDVDKLTQQMNSFSFVIKKSECLDLPPKLYSFADVEMGPQQKKAYNEMVHESQVTLGDRVVSAVLVITQLVKLHQIACGFIKAGENEPEYSFPEKNHRLETLLELVEQAPGKVIIWATYRYNIKQIVEALAEKFGANSVVAYYGEVSDTNKAIARREFKDPNSSVRYMVANPDSGKFGNTWTLATTVLYYSNSYNLESRQQSEDRAHRISQFGSAHQSLDPSAKVFLDSGEEISAEDAAERTSVLYIDLRVRGTVDDRISNILRKKKKLTDEIVQSNWRWLIGDSV